MNDDTTHQLLNQMTFLENTITSTLTNNPMTAATPGVDFPTNPTADMMQNYSITSNNNNNYYYSLQRPNDEESSFF